MKIINDLAAPVTAAALLLFAGEARADLQSFQLTNFIPSALAITSWPTNSQTTNYWSAGTNSATGQTNQYLLNWQTGKGIDVRNYNTVGFVFNANVTSSNQANLAFFLVKASISGSGATPQVIYTNSTFWYNDWETEAPAAQQINIPIPPGTNYAFCWRTNLDVSGCDYVGIYEETNNISFGSAGQAIGWTSNNVVAVNKKIIPFSLSGGNF